MRTINGVQVLDTLEELIDPAHTAIVCVDVQNDFCHPDGHFARHGKDISSVTEKVADIVGFIGCAQALGVQIFFLRQLTLPHGVSDSPAWLRFKCRDGKSPEYTLAGSWGAEFVDGLVPGDHDVVIEKLRPDAFIGTRCDQLLRANGVKTVVVLGTTTEGCVESTVRGASYHDYYVVIVRDLVASPNAQNHEGSMRLFEARYVLSDADTLLGVWRSD